MAYDPYKSLLANATREHLKRGADLNTHLVGNVFLPAIDPQHAKKPASSSPASLKHLKVIEQCIMAENKREERLAKCATIKERRVMTKRFQAQRERERELIQALMLGNYPERLQEVKLLETDVAAPMTPRQQLNRDITGLSAKVAKPDRVFRKADVTGGVPKAKPHAHAKFKLPQCNGSPGRKADARAQETASAQLSSPPRKAPPGSRETQTGMGDSPARKKRSPSRSARSESSVKAPKKQAKSARTPSATATKSSNQRAQSPYISPQGLLSKAARAAPQLTSLSDKAAEEQTPTDVVGFKAGSDAPDRAQQRNNSSVSFEGALSFSEAQRVAMGSDVSALKARREQIFAEIATQTTPRSIEKEDGIKKASSRPELPPVDLSVPVGAQHQDSAATTPRRPQSVRVVRSTRQAFLEGLARESEEALARKEATAQQLDSITRYIVDAESEAPVDEPCSVGVEIEGEDGSTEADQDDVGGGIEDNTEVQVQEAEEEYSEDGADAADQDFDPDSADSDEDLETDVAEILFDLIDLVDKAVVAEKERQEAPPSPRTVSPRPRSSVGRTTKYVLRIQSLFRGYRARIAFRLALYEDALSCGVLGAMPGTIQGRSGWYLDPKRLMAYYFAIPDPDGEWEQKFTLRCSRLVLTPYEMQQEVLSKAPAMLQQLEQQEDE